MKEVATNPNRKSITEEDGIHCVSYKMKEWYEHAKGMTLEKLPEFLSHLMNDYEHDYGTICHAISAGAIATMWALNRHEQGGITGFQASCIMWSIIRRWNYESNKCGLKMIDYDEMLYPQYRERFEKTISKETFESLQKVAKEKLSNKNDMMHEAVKAHLQSIIDGQIPFGYVIAEN